MSNTSHKLNNKNKYNMKRYINKLTMAFFLLAGFTFAACEQDNTGAIYSGGGLSFGNSTLTAQEVSDNDPTFTVDVFRGSTQGSLTGSVTLTTELGSTGASLDGCTVTDYAFADGESMATVTVNVDPLELGDELTVTLTLPDDVVSVGGISSVSVSVSKAYNWESVGMGTFADNYFYAGTAEVEILKAEGFERWRVMEPYTSLMESAAASGDDWVGSWAPSYVEFWNTGSGNTVYFTPFYNGQNYYGDSSQEIWVYPGDYFGDYSISNNRWVDSNTVQLAPFYYITDVGGWNCTEYDDIIVITLP